MRRGWIDHALDRRDLSGRKSTDPCVFTDQLLARRQINAEQLVFCDVALDPLDIGAELLERLIRLDRRFLELSRIERTGLRDVALDDESLQGHATLPLSITKKIIGPAG